MAAIQGKGGSVKSGSDAVAFVESWELGLSDEALETTGLGATARAYVGRGLPAGTFSLTWRALDNSDTATAALRAAMLDNATNTITLSLYESSTKYWSCTGIVTGFTQNTPVDGLVTGSCQGTCSGAITYT